MFLVLYLSREVAYLIYTGFVASLCVMNESVAIYYSFGKKRR